MGVNLAGVEVILGLRDQIDQLRRRVHELETMLREEGEASHRVRRNFALVRIKSGPLTKS